MIFRKLVPKNMFGGRILLPDFGAKKISMYTDEDLGDKSSDPRKSLLSIIANSGQVTVLVVERSHLNLLPDFVQAAIYISLDDPNQDCEADRPYSQSDIDKVKEKLKEWD
jgi:hypothetical protein